MNNINIMPMAGKGKRFLIKGFKIQKPFIKIDNKPMFIHSYNCMPNSKKNIFIFKNHFNKKINVESFFLKKDLNKIKIIYLKKNTKGQADTCLKAINYIEKNKSLFIHSCDCFISYNKKKYFNLIKNYDLIVFTTKPNSFHFRNKNSFGWVSGEKNNISNIECKKVASKNYKKDYVIVGSFAFRNKEVLKKCMNKLFLEKIKINNEYYLDSVAKIGLRNNLKVYNFVVDKYVSWGTPKELGNINEA